MDRARGGLFVEHEHANMDALEIARMYAQACSV